jgi:hypothetical protein
MTETEAWRGDPDSDFRIERAISQNRVEVVVVAIFENERPITGLGARLDWLLQGQISELLIQKRVSGQLGEFTLMMVDVLRQKVAVLLLGCGKNRFAGDRPPLSTDTQKKLIISLRQLKLKDVGLSLKDLGLGPKSHLVGPHEGIEWVWVT